MIRQLHQRAEDDLVAWEDLKLATDALAGGRAIVPALRDKNGRVRSRATLPGFRKGQKPGNHGKVYPPDYLTVGEVRILIMGRSRTSASGKRDRCWMAVTFGAGLRIAESLALLPSDITERDGHWRVHVRRGKGGKPRTVALAPDAVPYLHEWLEARAALDIDDHCRLFCTIAQPNVGGPLGAPQLRTMLKRVAGIAMPGRRVWPHMLRHSCAVNLAKHGVPLPVIQRQLGHSNAAVTSAYLQGMSDDEMFDAMTRIAWTGTEDDDAAA